MDAQFYGLEVSDKNFSELEKVASNEFSILSTSCHALHWCGTIFTSFESKQKTN